MTSNNFSRDTDMLQATPRDRNATNNFIHKQMKTNKLNSFKRHATVLDPLLFLYKWICAYYFTENFESFLCRVVARTRAYNNNNNIFLSIYTQNRVPRISRDISRDTPKTASRRDIFHREGIRFFV